MLKVQTILYKISKILDDFGNVQTMINEILKNISEYSQINIAIISLFDRKTKKTTIEASCGIAKEKIEKSRYRNLEKIIKKVLESGKPYINNNIDNKTIFFDEIQKINYKSSKRQGFICVPIIIEKETIGTISIDVEYDTETDLLSDSCFLQIVATMISQIVNPKRKKREEQNTIGVQKKETNIISPPNIIGKSNAMREVYVLIEQVSGSNATVLIRGESGTGKELVAQAIHNSSKRALMPFIKVNCAALPESVIESELFGHERGAFTTAIASRRGRFELANKGTIFLDEIGDLTPTTQVKLLRVLQEQEFERVGGSTTQKVDVRIIAATNKPLEEMMKKGEFREDLYYRLNVFPINMPPLRERKSDIVLLADSFAEKYGKRNAVEIKRISSPAIELLISYHWPGNVRELENCMERAVILTTDGVIHGNLLPPSLQSAESTNSSQEIGLQLALDSLEIELIEDALKSAKGNIAKAARILKITERKMGLRVEKYKINAKKYS